MPDPRDTPAGFIIHMLLKPYECPNMALACSHNFKISTQ